MSSGRACDPLRDEFNRWAEAGRGEAMQEDHWPIVRPVLPQMRIAADDRILDLGCGAGWLSRLLAAEAPRGWVLGADISDQMIRRARQLARTSGAQSTPGAPLRAPHFVVAASEALPCAANLFSRVISVESAYYWPDPRGALREIFRVLRAGGSAWILINYYRDNPHCHQWGEVFARDVKIPAHLFSAADWISMFRDAGFAEAAASRIPDPTPAPDSYTGRWFRDAQQLAAFRREGALLVRARKPD